MLRKIYRKTWVDQKMPKKPLTKAQKKQQTLYERFLRGEESFLKEVINAVIRCSV